MNSVKLNTWSHLNKVREQKPLVHNITNSVVTEFSANTLLACGASPLMAHEPDELTEIISITQVLVINIGTLDQTQINSMHIAIDEANKADKLIIIDPVGSGASKLRTNTATQLIKKSNKCIIKANASEILSLTTKLDIPSKGADSIAESSQAVSAAQALIKQYQLKCVVITGADDYIVSKEQISKHSNGDSLMSKVTGTGCSLAGVIGAFCAIESDYFSACQSAVSYYSLSGELASEISKGPGSFKVNFLDQLHNLNQIQIKANLNSEYV